MTAAIPSATTTAAADQLRLLLVSDIHCNLAHVEALVHRFSDSSNRVHAVLLSGDIANVLHPDQRKDRDPSAISAAEWAQALPAAEASIQDENTRQALAIVNTLAQLAPVYYIPGNHDPTQFFKVPTETRDESAAKQHTANLHRRTALLGYPYANDAAFSEHVKELESKCIEFTRTLNESAAPVQWIWLTHCGPSDLSTTDENGVPYDPAPNRIMTGSAWGYTRFGQTHVCNPGSLTESHYGVLKLVRTNAGRWQFGSIELATL
ncbi:Metallo-dependent phosphatase-like protein [Thamnocephalis sphaerospora]|uniref:Metallo-dependent phosphatase-like protein n=1 Tax=Thamnocephalis sphaerospora TaxID=78915 RepID=A0A4P9XW97_9FUNG|nr:Metallo-dependent phosphatase-like protein [Thamnocephalis sphaerospora]|eukprot:RKP10584.1 Metallo-dependent phosphatase-like protein [Thamnocephalis sphaerospora]